MRRPKTGFTLAELLVAVLCGVLILSTAAGAAVFLKKADTAIISDCENIYAVKIVRDHILSKTELKTAEEFKANIRTDSGDLMWQNETVIRDTKLESVDFYVEDGKIILCELVFDGETYRFAAGTERGEE